MDKLEEELNKKVKKEFFRKPKSKTVEQALKEALDNTTPEQAGKANTEDFEPQDEWL